MKTKSFYTLGCVVGLAMTAHAQDNSIGFVLGGASVDGDDAAYQRRFQNDANFYGGISNFHYETGDDVLYTIDGHAVFGTNNHELILGAEKDGTGYLELGYSEFRTFYDGSGGFFPGATPDWVPAANDELYLDRGKVWVEAGLRMEDLPAVTFRYSHLWRDGQKDSTHWGRGASGGINPTLSTLDETRDIFELDIEQTFGDTDLALGFVYENTEHNNDRLILEDTTHTDVYDADLFNAHASSVTRFGDDMILSFGYAYTDMDTDMTGSERITASGPRGHDFWDYVGEGSLEKHVVNANFWWQATPCLQIIPSLRFEHEEEAAAALFWEQPHRGAPENLLEGHDSEYDSLTEQVEVRYDGVENTLLYAKVLANQTTGDTHYGSVDMADPLDPHGRLKVLDSTSEKYVVGGIWYVTRCANIAAEYFHKDYDADYDNHLHGMDAHLASHDISTDDINVRLTWRPRSDLTLVTRYDYMNSTYKSRGIDGNDMVLPEVKAGKTTRSMLSQSATYTPVANLYLTGAVSWVWGDTRTAASNSMSNLATFDNDWLTAGLTVGYAIDDKTDITASYNFYYAENYALPVNAVGYGTDLEEHVFSLRLNRLINENMLWNVGYAFANSNDGTSGGNNDFDAHMLSSGLQITF